MAWRQGKEAGTPLPNRHHRASAQQQVMRQARGGARMPAKQAPRACLQHKAARPTTKRAPAISSWYRAVQRGAPP
jgi:hypothetical protein